MLPRSAVICREFDRRMPEPSAQAPNHEPANFTRYEANCRHLRRIKPLDNLQPKPSSGHKSQLTLPPLEVGALQRPHMAFGHLAQKLSSSGWPRSEAMASVPPAG